MRYLFYVFKFDKHENTKCNPQKIRVIYFECGNTAKRKNRSVGDFFIKLTERL